MAGTPSMQLSRAPSFGAMWRHLRERGARATRAAVAALARRARAVRPEYLLWVVLAATFLAFLLVLVLQPTAAGRGGR